MAVCVLGHLHRYSQTLANNELHQVTPVALAMGKETL